MTGWILFLATYFAGMLYVWSTLDEIPAYFKRWQALLSRLPALVLWFIIVYAGVIAGMVIYFKNRGEKNA